MTILGKEETPLKPLFIYAVITGKEYYECADGENPYRKEWSELAQKSRDLFGRAAMLLRQKASLCCECGMQAPLEKVGGACKPCSILPPKMLEMYALLHQDFARGAYDERESDGSYGEDGKEELADQMDEKAHKAGYNIVWQTIGTAGHYVLESMTAQEKLEYDAALIAVQIEQELGLEVSAPLHYQQLIDQMPSDPFDKNPFVALDAAAARLGWKFQIENRNVVLVPVKEERP